MTHKLTPKQYKAAQMVAMGEMTAVIEKTLKMRRHTLTRWRRLKAFQGAVQQCAQDMCSALPLRMLHVQYLSVSLACDELKAGFPSTHYVGAKQANMFAESKKIQDITQQAIDAMDQRVFEHL